MSIDLKKIVTLKEFSKMNPENFPFSRVRHLVNNREKNGFNSCLSMIGNRFYIDIEELEKWIESKKSYLI